MISDSLCFWKREKGWGWQSDKPGKCIFMLYNYPLSFYFCPGNWMWDFAYIHICKAIALPLSNIFSFFCLLIPKESSEHIKNIKTSSNPVFHKLIRPPFSFLVSRDRVSVYPWLSWNILCRPGWPWKHRDPPPASASWVLLGSKVHQAGHEGAAF